MAGSGGGGASKDLWFLASRGRAKKGDLFSKGKKRGHFSEWPSSLSKKVGK